MKWMNWAAAAAVVTVVWGIAGCGGNKVSTQSETVPVSIKVGVLAGPHAEFMEEVKKQAQNKGLQIQIVEFNDFVQPDEALNSGEIDATMSQHLPYLENQIKDRGYKLSSVGKTILFPMGVYSNKIKSKDEIKDHMNVAIPNDPSNGGRALEILDKAGIIKLKENIGGKATVHDIVSNPYELTFNEVDAAMIPQLLPDLDFAVMNNSYARRAGKVPTKDALILEDGHSQYTNIVAVRTVDKDKSEIKMLMDVIRTPEMKQFVETHFQGTVVAAW